MGRTLISSKPDWFGALLFTLDYGSLSRWGKRKHTRGRGYREATVSIPALQLPLPLTPLTQELMSDDELPLHSLILHYWQSSPKSLIQGTYSVYADNYLKGAS